jgi:N6-adenosine-specific RNA methylase IME4
MSRSILFRDEIGTIILLDIPASVEDGQQTRLALRSAPPLEEPFPSIEPKGHKRDRVLASIPEYEREYHESMQSDISKALDIVNMGYGKTSWCLSRNTVNSPVSNEQSLDGVTSECQRLGRAPILLSSTEKFDAFSSIGELEGCLVHNSQDQQHTVRVDKHGEYLIPPKAAFILGKLTQDICTLKDSLRVLMPNYEGYDMIVMDPPWDNRSVRRSSKYNTQHHQDPDPFEIAAAIVRDLLSTTGMVGIWITNKAAVRSKVETTFKGYHLYEEWIWIKTTTRGEPITRLDGIWRHPYEILLLYRNAPTFGPPKRRIIAAVPDVHSRKPCLKNLLDENLPAKYTVLELFARSLTAGWSSWGDEVLKFQHASEWMPQD